MTLTRATLSGQKWWAEQDRIAQLRDLWDNQGNTASQIAVRLGTGKNAVIGMVHRLGLSKRRGVAVVASSKSSGTSCAWPHGDPRLPGFYFCGADVVSGYPYCSSHKAVAYQRSAKQE